jgi:hypothetical protein
MIPQKYKEKQIESIDRLIGFVEEVDKDFFKTEIKKLSEKQILERYKLAKEIYLKEIDSIIKIEKDNKDMTNEEQLIMGAILSMSGDEKQKLKNFILELKKDK